MSKEPALPLRIKEFLNDTYGMTAEEIGGYIALLLFQWDKGSLPGDDKKLRGIAKVGLKSVQNLKKPFSLCEDGTLKSEWLDRQRRFLKKQNDNGKKGGRPKKQNPNHNPNHNPNTNPDNNPNVNPNSKPNHNPEKSKKLKITPLPENQYPPIYPPTEAKETFKSVLQAYPGTKRGPGKEWDNFIKKCKGENILEILKKMQDMIELETKHKAWVKDRKGFDMAWKNFQTWINGGCWEQEFDTEFITTLNGKPKTEPVNSAWEKM